MNFDPVKKSVLFEIAPVKCGIATCEPYWFVKEERGKPFHRMYYTYSGEVTYEDSTCTEQLQPDTFYVFPTHLPYTIRHNPGHPLSCMWAVLQVKPDFVNGLISFPARHNDLLYHTLKSLEATLRISDTNIDLLRLQFKQLFHILAHMANLDCILDKRIIEAIAFIQKNLHRSISVAQLARQYALDMAYFSRLFKKITGLPPQRYILEHKIAKAAQKLTQGSSVKEIAYQFGFSDEKEFSRIFKKYRSMPPSKYRKMHEELHTVA
ncbi:MAG: helix-turn-helix domain-containing protein [Chitinivibrionales bacterium]|nr:helix-turn-helix domain-containing protein [Chitinivibrionales bacterium]